MKKLIICLLMFAGTFQISGMGYITRLLQRGQATPIDYDKQLENAIAHNLTPAYVKLAIDALEHGAEPDVVSSIGSPILTDIIQRCSESHLKPLFDALIKANIDVNATNKYGVPPLAEAINKVVRRSPSSGVIVTPNSDAELYHYIESLLKAGARTTDYMHQSQDFKILYKVAGNDVLIRVLKLMIAADAPIHMCDDIRGTPLQWAAYKGEVSSVKTLLAAGASVLAKDKNGENAIDAANRQEEGQTSDAHKASKRAIAELLQRTVVGRKAKRAVLVAVLQGKGKVKQTAPICALPEPLMCLIVEYIVPTI